MANIHTRSKFRTGDWVLLTYGTREVLAKIIEDRGKLGVNQRRLYRVVPLSEGANAFEIPEDDLRDARHKKKTLLHYLCEGGLRAILESNTSGGKRRPTVWIYWTGSGAATHSYSPVRDGVRAEDVPFFALHDGRIFTPKVDEVRDFLMEIGLDTNEASAVIHAVGTAP